MHIRLLQALHLGALALIVAIGPAQAFEITARSDNPLLTPEAIKARVNEVAAQVGHTVPNDRRVRISVYSRALESQFEGAMIYLHRIQLTRLYQSDPPYPFAGYLPLRTTERYGVDDEAGMRAKFDEALQFFFTQLKDLKPEGDDAEGSAAPTP